MESYIIQREVTREKRRGEVREPSAGFMMAAALSLTVITYNWNAFMSDSEDGVLINIGGRLEDFGGAVGRLTGTLHFQVSISYAFDSVLSHLNPETGAVQHFEIGAHASHFAHFALEFLLFYFVPIPRFEPSDF